MITGPTLSLRPISILDWQVFVECYADWPRDALGYFSLARCQGECDVAVAQNRRVTYPLTPESNWQLTLLVSTTAPIGLVRAQANGLTVKVLNVVLIPSERGKGYMVELQALLQRFAFEALGATEATYEVFQGPALSHVSGRAKYEETGMREGQAGTLVSGRITRDSWAQWVEAHPEEDQVNKAANVIQVDP
jgi:hypothetical protein